MPIENLYQIITLLMAIGSPVASVLLVYNKVDKRITIVEEAMKAHVELQTFKEDQMRCEKDKIVTKIESLENTLNRHYGQRRTT